MAKGFQTLTGFRDFRPEDCAVRNYLFEIFREVSRRYGFVEYETPILESTELYLKKSGGELSSQLFRFEDQGGRDVTLRPEVTASLGRLVTSCQRDYPKPLRWFEIGQCFRYEKPQKGRTREFYQFNVDLLGESSAGADAELIALSIDLMSELLQIVDKLERNKPEVTEENLSKIGLTTEVVKDAIENPASLGENLDAVLADLEARGMKNFIEVDLSIVRGLAYYTGVVFEVFDAKKSLRAVAGGGRYDTLITALSDGSVDLPAAGFAIGDVVIRHLIEETPHANDQLQAYLANIAPSEVYVVLADEEKRAEALALVSELRDMAIATTFSFTPAKVGKQFKQAEQLGADYAIVIGSEYPQLTLKNLRERTEETISAEDDVIQALLGTLI